MAAGGGAEAGAGAADQKFMTLDLGQCIGGPRFIMCAAMPFGYVNSPYVFTRVMRVPVGEMRAEAYNDLARRRSFTL